MIVTDHAVGRNHYGVAPIMVSLRRASDLSCLNSHLIFYALAHMHKPCEAIESVASITRRLGFDTVRIPVDNAVAGVDDAVENRITVYYE